MDDLKKLNNDIYNSFNNFLENITNVGYKISNEKKKIYSDSDINSLFLILYNIFLLLDSLLQFFYSKLNDSNLVTTKNNKNIQFMIKSLNNTHYNLVKTYISQYKIKEKYSYSKLLTNISNYKKNTYISYDISINNTNLDIIEIDELLTCGVDIQQFRILINYYMMILMMIVMMIVIILIIKPRLIIYIN